MSHVLLLRLSNHIYAAAALSQSTARARNWQWSSLLNGNEDQNVQRDKPLDGSRGEALSCKTDTLLTMWWQWHQLDHICKSFAPSFSQITMPAPHDNFLQLIILYTSAHNKIVVYLNFEMCNEVNKYCILRARCTNAT